MLTWLAAAAAVPLAVSHVPNFGAHGIHRPTAADPHAEASFSLPKIPQFSSQSPLQDGMIAEEEVAPNAHIGLGLAPMLGRNIHSVRIEQEPVPTRNPGMTFVVKFPG
jgi:hypothetical protein